MASQITVTAKTGPALQATTLVLGNVTSILFDLVARVVTVRHVDMTSPHEFDLGGVTTVTFTISGSNYTMVLS